MDGITSVSPFQLNGAINFLPQNMIGRRVETLIEQAFSLKRLNEIYSQFPSGFNDQEFLIKVLETFNISYHVSDENLARIPKTGPLVIVANHPFGAIEGIILAAMLMQVRPDVKIMANYMLKRIPEISDLFIAVNPFGGTQAKQDNMTPMKEALRWVKQGRLLVVFPAGEVSYFNSKKRQVIDPAWSPNIGRFISLTKAPVQCVHFNGNNSILFHMAGMMHPKLRTALLPRELLNKADRTIRIRIGQPIPHSKLSKIGLDQQLIEHLKLRTYMLRNAGSSDDNTDAQPQKLEASIPPLDSTLMTMEVAQLTSQQHLVDNGELQVYVAKAKQIPNILQEIGRLREVTFRAAGEGTGKSIDLDFYDNYYLHLFIWNQEKNEVVAAYRLGQADKIMEKQGIVGLYSYSLFKYKKRLIDRLSPALELGRSFVRPEYQRSFSPLLLLWKGISSYVSKNPQYRWLFGPVSISNEYQHASQQLMVDFFRSNNRFPELTSLTKARNGFKKRNLGIPSGTSDQVRNIDTLSGLVSEIEHDQKGIPILLKQYMKLGGQILEFNVDPNFNQALDGLIVVDLLSTDPKVLAKYMGKETLQQYLAEHQALTQPPLCVNA